MKAQGTGQVVAIISGDGTNNNPYTCNLTCTQIYELVHSGVEVVAMLGQLTFHLSKCSPDSASFVALEVSGTKLVIRYFGTSKWGDAVTAYTVNITTLA